MSKFLFLGGTSAIAAAVFLAPAAAPAQPWAPAGSSAQSNAIIPNFSSTQYGWLSYDDELKPMMTGPRPVRADPAHPYFGNQSGRQPTFRISDLTNPILTEWSKNIMKPSNDAALAGKFPYSFQPRCMPGGVPGQLLGIFEPVYFVQSPKEVLMIWQRDHQVRHIYMNVPHTENPKPSWYGESVGHYEGNELVVDTIGLSPKAPVDNWRTPHSEKLHVVERFSRVENGDTLQAIITIEDPVAFTTPWTVYQRWERENQEMIEASCAENNASYYGKDDESSVPVAEKPDF